MSQSSREPSTSLRKIQNVKRTQSWRDKGRLTQKKFKLDKVPSIAASSYKRFPAFKTWFESSKIHFNNIVITSNVRVVDNITLHLPLHRSSHCSRCAEVKDQNLLLPLFDQLCWKDLETRDVPFDVPLILKPVATALRSMILYRSDNSSSKAFTRVLLDTIRTYYLCVPHATHCKVVSPKSAFDKGGFQIHVCQELKIAQPLFDSSSLESSSDAPTPTDRERRNVPTVSYKDVIIFV